MRMYCSAMMVAAAVGATFGQTYLMVPDSTADVLMLFDADTGNLVNPAFINGSGLWTTPKDAIQVGDEIWISDQVEDSVFRYDLNGNAIGTIVGGMDNIRGMAFANGTVYVSNAGTANGAPDDAVIMFDVNGNNLGFFPAGDPFDVTEYNGDLLVANIAADTIDRHSFTGMFIGTFAGGGMDFPEQVSVRASNGNVLVATFSGAGGIYEFNPSGVQVNFYPVGAGLRGVHELGNGNIMWTSGSGVFVYDVVAGTSQLIAAAGGQYVNPLVLSQPCYPDCDGSGTLDLFDFLCFVNEFNAGNPYADCDGSGTLDLFDFLCFVNEFNAGCP